MFSRLSFLALIFGNLCLARTSVPLTLDGVKEVADNYKAILFNESKNFRENIYIQSLKEERDLTIYSEDGAETYLDNRVVQINVNGTVKDLLLILWNKIPHGQSISVYSLSNPFSGERVHYFRSSWPIDFWGVKDGKIYIEGTGDTDPKTDTPVKFTSVWPK